MRLSSLEPWDLDEDFFDLWQAAEGRLCRHLHLPLQSGSAPTLRRMARKTTPAAFRTLVGAARKAIPGLALTTDIIVGFPGETAAEFHESLAFVEEMAFAGGHVFTFSARPGTAASRMPNQVAKAILLERSQLMRSVVEMGAAQFRRRFLGEEMDVLWENGAVPDPITQGWQISGLTDNYLRVQARSPRRLWNVITPVQLETVIASSGGEVLCGRLMMG
jgi:threonylcarbamoyladenosine tRNA methylthiotransferase MtaB